MAIIKETQGKIKIKNFSTEKFFERELMKNKREPKARIIQKRDICFFGLFKSFFSPLFSEEVAGDVELFQRLNPIINLN